MVNLESMQNSQRCNKLIMLWKDLKLKISLISKKPEELSNIFNELFINY
jgi:hypothetical protein